MHTDEDFKQFHLALKSGDESAIIRLATTFPELVLGTEFIPSELHEAASAGNLVALKALILAGFDINLTYGDHAQTPLCFAAYNNDLGCLDSVKWLLRNGATPGLTLTSAVVGGSEEIIKLLLAAGADPMQRTGTPPRNAYEQALQIGRSDLAALVAPKNSDFDLIQYLTTKFGCASNKQPHELPQVIPFALKQFDGPTCVAICTVGLSAHDMGLPYRSELMVRLPLAWPNTNAIGLDVQWPVEFLLDIAASALQSPILQTFHAIGNGEPPQPLSADVGFSGVLLVPENDEDAPFDGTGNPVRIFSLMPIYAEEIALAKRSIAKLADALDKAGMASNAIIGTQRKNVVEASGQKNIGTRSAPGKAGNKSIGTR